MKQGAIVAAAMVFLLAAGCTKKEQSSPQPQMMSAAAEKGKAIFLQRGCDRCHRVPFAESEPEHNAPDLTNAFLANDSLFVRAHLKTLEESRMPNIRLTEPEIRLVSRFVAELHAAAHRAEVSGETDAQCPICYARVFREEARMKNLWFRYLGEDYYFECRECKELFARAPEAYRQLYRTRNEFSGKSN